MIFTKSKARFESSFSISLSAPRWWSRTAADELVKQLDKTRFAVTVATFTHDGGTLRSGMEAIAGVNVLFAA